MSWKLMQWFRSPMEIDGDFSQHMTMPMILFLSSGKCVFFWSPRDTGGKSWILGTYASFEEGILACDWAARFIVMRPGEYGAFDSDGVTGSDVHEVDEGRINLAYFGWQRLPDDAWLNGIGVLQGPVGSELSRSSNGPLLARDYDDQFSVAYPFFSRPKSETLLYCSYASFANPRKSNAYSYVVRSAEFDVQAMSLRSRTGVDLEPIRGMSAYSRPTTIQFQDSELIFCSVRGEKYQINGWLRDGMSWRRASQYDCAELALELGESATCYQFPFVRDGRLYLLFNGDGFGLTGFGLAVWCT